MSFRKIIKRIPFILLLIIGLSLFFRLVNLHADPLTIPFLDTQDEGLYSYAARNFYLFGKWASDNFNYGIIMPIFPPLQLVGVLILGVHNYAFRMISVISSLLTIAVLFYFLRKNAGIKSAMVSALSLAFNFYYLTYSRSGLPEVTMLLFSLLTFIFCFEMLKAKKRQFLNALLTGLFFILAFFTKQSSAHIFGVVIFSIFLLVLQDYKNQSLNVRKYITIVTGILLPIFTCILLYVIYIYIPNKDIWFLNYKATIGVNRIHKVFFTVPYLVKSLADLISSKFWQFLPFLTIGIIIYSITFIKKFIKRNVPPLDLLIAVWFAICFVQFILMPTKLGRFMTIAILPITIMFALLFENKNWHYITKGRSIAFKYGMILLVIGEFLFNILMSYTYMIRFPRFTYLDSVNTLKTFIKKEDLSNLPVHWMMNADFRTINSFLVPMDDSSFQKFYDTYGWPKYMIIGDPQTELYKEKTPLLFSYLEPVRYVNHGMIYKIEKSR